MITFVVHTENTPSEMRGWYGHYNMDGDQPKERIEGDGGYEPITLGGFFLWEQKGKKNIFLISLPLFPDSISLVYILCL